MTNIETERLILRPLRSEDAESVFEYAKDSEVAQYVTWYAHQSIEDANKYVDFAVKFQQKSPLCPLAIVQKENPNKVIGTVGIEVGAHEYEGILSYTLSRAHWRKGFVYEASNALMKVAFEENKFQRISAWCIKENVASSALMRKLGMKFEGCMRSKDFRKGQFWDLEYYAIMKEEWEAQKGFAHVQSGQEYHIQFSSDPSKEDSSMLHQGLAEYAYQKKGMDPIEHFGFFVRDNDGAALAGCTATILFGVVHTDSLWVSEPLRGKGIGTRLLQSVEQRARQKQCTMATINTMDWEALPLYQSLGYEVDLARAGYANNSTMYFLRKALV